MNTTEQIKNLELKIKELENENRQLHETVDFLTRKLYGTKSEKTSSLCIEGQMSLFDEVETSADEKAPEPTMEDIGPYRRKKQKGHKEELLKNVPHEKRLCTLAEDERFCQTCGTPLHSIGQEFVRSEIQFIPAQVKVIDYYVETFECRECRKNNRDYIEKSPLPDPVLPHSIASPSSIAWIIHQKYELAVPLYRLEKEWEALGVGLSRATMSNWLLASYRYWLEPVVELLKKKLLEQNYLHIDETTVQVLGEENRKNTTDSYMWVYCSIKKAENPVRYFEYQPGRSGDYPKDFLDGYAGYIHTDGYRGYEKVTGVTRCMCWSHLRRYFVDALPKDIKSPQATIPAEAIQRINQLFEFEKRLEVLTPEKRKEERRILETEILDGFWTWAESVSKDVAPESKLGKAFTYAFNQKDGLMNYLLDGNCAISNNLAENSIRPFTVGRKNWLFSGSPKGAKTSAGIYTLVETAKANGLSPMKYIHYILRDLPAFNFQEFPEDLEEFLPWNPVIQKMCR